MRGLLVRVGINSTDWNWNAPVRQASREFAYINLGTPDMAITDINSKDRLVQETSTTRDLLLPRLLSGQVNLTTN